MLLAVGLLFAGCEIEEDADADTTTTTDTGTPPGDTTDTGTPPNLLEYRYVRIDDVSGNATTIDGGADIDAIILFKAAGGASYADTVEGFEHGGGFGTEVDPSDALFGPDAFENYSGVGAGTDRCHVDEGYVSLGGDGGMLIVHMQEEMEAGDTLSVLEVGDCEFWDDDSKDAIPDDVKISVSVGKAVDGQWTILGTGSGPEIWFDLTAADLPPVEAN
jgi:hypothetical protein